MKSHLLSLLCAIFVLHGVDAMCVPRPRQYKVVSKATRPPAPVSPSPAPTSAPVPSTHARSTPANAPSAMQSAPTPSPVKSTTPLTPSKSVQEKSSPTPSKSDPMPSPPSSTPPSPNQTNVAKSPAVTASVIALCKKTDYPELCQTSVAPLVPASGNVGPREMLIMQINATVSKSADALNQVTKHLAEPITIPRLKGALDVCKSNYEDLKTEFDQTVQALAISDMGTVGVMLSAAIEDVSSCEDGFAESPGLPTPMADVDDELRKLISNCLALADLLK